MYGYEAPSRRESVSISLKLDKSAADRHKLAIAALRLRPGTISEGDSLTVSYEFNIHYYGDVVRGLGAVHDLVSDEAIVREANVSELIHGRSVILEVAAKLTRLIDKLEGNPCPKPSKRGWLRRVRSSISGGS